MDEVAAPRPGRARGASGGLEPSSTLPMGDGGRLLPHCRVGGWKYTPVPQLARVPVFHPRAGDLGRYGQRQDVGTYHTCAGMEALVSRGTAAGARTQMQPVFSRAVASHPIASHRIAASISGRLSGSRRRRRCAHAPPSPDRQWPESFACSRGPTSSLSGGTSWGARRCGRSSCALCLPVYRSVGPPACQRALGLATAKSPVTPRTTNPPPRRPPRTLACTHLAGHLYAGASLLRATEASERWRQ